MLGVEPSISFVLMGNNAKDTTDREKKRLQLREMKMPIVSTDNSILPYKEFI